MDHHLFLEEEDILKQSKQVAKRYQYSNLEMYEEYKKLLTYYEKLLKTSRKTNRISDILTKMLQEREVELHDANNNLKNMGESRKKLISDLSHDMGSPMIAVQNYLKAIIEGKIPGSNQHLQAIYDNVSMVNHLIEKLFELSVIEAGHSKFNMKQVSVEEVHHLIMEFEFDITNQNLNFEYEFVKQKELYVMIDKMRIKQVIMNLIYNALKYTPQKGLIRITTSIKEKDVANDGPRDLFISVFDSGVGIDQDSLPYVFERFVKGNKNGGTGLGLAIAKEIVIHHGGTITVRSTENEGSEFCFTIPIC